MFQVGLIHLAVSATGAGMTRLVGLSIGRHDITFQIIHVNGSRLGKECFVSFELLSRCSYGNGVSSRRQPRFYATMTTNEGHTVPIQLYADEILAQVRRGRLARHKLTEFS